MKNTLILLFCTLVAACNAEHNQEEKQTMFSKPKPEKYVIFSPLEGTLLKNGKPLANTTIKRRLKWNGNEEGLLETFSTDAQGRFSLPIHEEELSLGMLNQFVGTADIEIETEKGNEYLWTSSKFSPEVFAETGGKVDDLLCDINHDEIAVPMGPTAILTKCRWKNMPE